MTSITRLTRAATMDDFAADAAGAQGLSVRELAPLTVVHVRTQNSKYRIVVSRGGDVFITGGRFFPEPTAAQFDGASAGGSCLKVGWIGVGLRMEIRERGRRIVTSPVREVAVEQTGRVH